MLPMKGTLVTLVMQKGGCYKVAFRIESEEIDVALLGKVLGDEFVIDLIPYASTPKLKDAPTGVDAPGTTAVAKAGELCKRATFQLWFLGSKIFTPDDPPGMTQLCRDDMCTVLGIESRKELKANAEAATKFWNMVRQFSRDTQPPA